MIYRCNSETIIFKRVYIYYSYRENLQWSSYCPDGIEYYLRFFSIITS